MSKYIKLEDALERLNQLYHSYEVEEWLNSLPTIDIVTCKERPTIIRCRNCRHDNNCEIQYSAQAGSKFFCGLAERKERK